MNLLLDTHTLLWTIAQSDKLSTTALREITDINNSVSVSAVSLWEIALKHGLGKLTVEHLNLNDIPLYCKKMGFKLIPLKPEEALDSYGLSQKSDNKDPFDRMLIYQCIRNNYVMVSKDSKFSAYWEDGLTVIW
jgi:PIN domain nuclease of toxin-antitoxin system